jgi:Bacteriophage HK97-gp10, putative tail-component
MGVTWSPELAEHEQQLATLGVDVNHDAASIVKAMAEEAAAEIRATYPVRTGTLRDSLTVSEVTTDPAATKIVIQNTAPYALAFEYGQGGEPAGKVFVPITLRKRRDLQEAVMLMIETIYGATEVHEGY